MAVVLRKDSRVRAEQEGQLRLRVPARYAATPPAHPPQQPRPRVEPAGLPDEAAVFMDEVDVNLNQQVGSMWM
jgi:hypothetical protein